MLYKSKVIAVVLAGGSGHRFNQSTPKQLFKVAGKTIIEHTVTLFEKSPFIDEIAIVCNATIKENIEQFVLDNQWTKVKKILNGGKERYDSTYSALKSYETEAYNTKILFHDAVRPLFNPMLIKDIIDSLEIYSGVAVAVPSVDTVLKLTKDIKEIELIPDRKYLWRGQTPQAFKLGVIQKAYSLAMKEGDLAFTDDCGILLKYLPDEKIGVIRGEETNIKVTYPEDIYLLDKLFQTKATKLRSNFDGQKLFGKVLVVFGGSAGIGLDIVSIGMKYGAKCYAFSRSLNNTDVSDYKSVKKALDDVYSIENRIDYVIDSAAILVKKSLLTMDSTQIKSSIDTNYFGVVNIALASHPYLKESKGQLLYFTSSSYTRGRPYYSIYTSTKAAVVNFVQSISEEWESEDIRVNCICPERTNTPMYLSKFKVVDLSTLLDSKNVAMISLMTLCENFTGQIIDIKVGDFKN